MLWVCIFRGSGAWNLCLWNGISRILTALLSKILKVLKHVFNGALSLADPDIYFFGVGGWGGGGGGVGLPSYWPLWEASFHGRNGPTLDPVLYTNMHGTSTILSYRYRTIMTVHSSIIQGYIQYIRYNYTILYNCWKENERSWQSRKKVSLYSFVNRDVITSLKLYIELIGDHLYNWVHVPKQAMFNKCDSGQLWVSQKGQRPCSESTQSTNLDTG